MEVMAFVKFQAWWESCTHLRSSSTKGQHTTHISTCAGAAGTSSRIESGIDEASCAPMTDTTAFCRSHSFCSRWAKDSSKFSIPVHACTKIKYSKPVHYIKVVIFTRPCLEWKKKEIIEQDFNLQPLGWRADALQLSHLALWWSSHYFVKIFVREEVRQKFLFT